MSDLAKRIRELPAERPAELRPAHAMRLAREIAAEGEALGLRPVRAAFLSSFSLAFVEPQLVVAGAARGLLLRPYFGAFGQLEQELAEGGGAAAFAPDVLLLALRPEDLDPDAVVRYHATGGARFARLADGLVERLRGCVRSFRARSRGPVLVANFAAPELLPLGVFDANAPDSLGRAVEEANHRLREALAEETDALVWDYAGLVRERGAAGWTDRRLMAIARTPVAAAHHPALAHHLVRTLHALLRPPAKCLVLDLDNTLWGGVVGDDGLEGLQLGDDQPGVAFKNLQRAALALRDRGILLALASKNERETAERVFREHPEMLIRWEHLAAVRIDWEAKSANLRALAAELKLGADALVLFDDNPVERAEVRANAPEVRVIEVPSSPLDFEAALARCGHFDTAGLTEEDAQRAELYRQESERRRERESAESVEDFLHGLEMTATVGRLGPATLQRVAQLVAKTNQFNLTTRRHGRAELEAMARDPDSAVAWLRLRDRFGDAGLVCVGILRLEDDAAVIDTLLMSCRVMGRGVERAFLAHLLEEARALGCRRVLGDYLPTAKNGLVKDLLPELGFAPHSELPAGGARYELDLERSGPGWPGWPGWPDWIARETGDGAGP